MPLGTLDRRPPPLFREGPSALTKLAFCTALALFLMVADARFKLMDPARSALALVLHPLQRTLLGPVDAWEQLRSYLRGMEAAQAAEDRARQQLTEQAVVLNRAAQLQAENQRLRQLLTLREALTVAGQSAEVLYESGDAYSRRVVVDRGSKHGVQRGAPVVNEGGVLGQVTRVYTLSSEVTLLSDRDASIPVLNTRTQQRGVAFGGERGVMELRFTPADADIQVGDLLATSGMDGIYPSDLAVARVSEVERRGDSSFARVRLLPTSRPDSARHVLVLTPLAIHEATKAEAAAAAASEAQARLHARDRARDKARAAATAARPGASAAAGKASAPGGHKP
ncbi:rod shape-determining protein MreC [Roseateles sp. BYS180W]|uniref:Cell shape-determining protein MreC n=1 Tax=Roseateles rivi TaxID=3299028 RepID=A0ABW7FUK5_9BURK